MKTSDNWRQVLPPEWHSDAEQLLAYLQNVPEMKPQHCPWCIGLNFMQYPSAARMYQCRDCKRRFTPWTGTPFANCRHQALWGVYVRIRLCGHGMYKTGQFLTLSHGASEYREAVIEKLLIERWPSLLDWWCGCVDRITNKPIPLRTTPFTNKEDAWAHHNHEYIQCLECGKMYSALDAHLRLTHFMSAMEYRERWQIMKQIPLAGLANRRSHSEAINARIASGDIDLEALVNTMHETNQRKKRKRPFNPDYIGRMHGQRLKVQKLWERSPVIKTVSEAVQKQFVARMRQRPLTGEKVKDIARDAGVNCNTLYEWLKRWPENM